MRLDQAEYILKEVADYFNMSISDIKKEGREEQFLFPRFLVIGLTTEFTKLNPKRIMEVVNRDRAIYYNAMRSFHALKYMPEMKNAYDYLKLKCDPKKPDLPDHDKTFFNKYRKAYKWEIKNKPKIESINKKWPYKQELVYNWEVLKASQNEI